MNPNVMYKIQSWLAKEPATIPPAASTAPPIKTALAPYLLNSMPWIGPGYNRNGSFVDSAWQSGM